MRLLNSVSQSIPLEFIDEIRRGLPVLYKTAHQHAFANYAPPQALNLLPFIRSNLIDEFVHNTATKFSELKVSTEVNGSGNWRYTLVTAGKVLFSAARSDYPGQAPRYAEYRNGYAAYNDLQLQLMGIEPIAPPEYDCYCVLTHGPLSKNLDQVSFAELTFPAPGMKSLIDAIPLEDFCIKEAPTSTLQAGEEEILDNVIPMLRPDIKKKQLE